MKTKALICVAMAFAAAIVGCDRTATKDETTIEDVSPDASRRAEPSLSERDSGETTSSLIDNMPDVKVEVPPPVPLDDPTSASKLAGDQKVFFERISKIQNELTSAANPQIQSGSSVPLQELLQSVKSAYEDLSNSLGRDSILVTELADDLKELERAVTLSANSGDRTALSGALLDIQQVLSTIQQKTINYSLSEPIKVP